jgi:hypothetical protein
MRRWLFVIACLSCSSIPTHCQNVPPPPDPCGVVVGPRYRLSDISPKDDLVKLSGDWWGTDINRLPTAAKMKTGDYSVGDERVPRRQKFEILLPTTEFGSKNWTPQELRAFAFKFKNGEGLVLITGLLKQASADQLDSAQPLPTGMAVSQAVAVKALTSRYGKPTRIIGFGSAPSVGTTYVWEFDKAILEVSSALFNLSPAKDFPENCRKAEPDSP